MMLMAIVTLMDSDLMPCSDIDLCMCGQVKKAAVKPRFHGDIDRSNHSEYVQIGSMGKEYKGDLLRTVGDILKRARITKPMSIHYILHARVPIINFIDAQYGIECDLSVSSDNVQFKAALVRSLSGIDPRFEPLYRVVKAWAKAHNLNDGSRATFNSWCLILVFISYLQSPSCPAGPLLPPLRALFFAEEEDEETRILSPNSKYDAGAALDIARIRAMSARAELVEKRNLSKRSPPLIELFAGFVDFVLELLNHSLETFSKGHEKDRVCLMPWTGSVTNVPPDRFHGRVYAFMVEDPFDADDNVGRTLGTWKDEPQQKLGFLIAAFHSTRDILNDLMTFRSSTRESETRRAREALAWLYGPQFLVDMPCLSPEIFSPQLLDMCIQGSRRKMVMPGQLMSQGISPGSAIVEADALNEEHKMQAFESFMSAVIQEGELRGTGHQDSAYSPLPDLILTPKAHQQSHNRLSVADKELQQARQKERQQKKQREKREQQKAERIIQPNEGPVGATARAGPAGSTRGGRAHNLRRQGERSSRPQPPPASSMDSAAMSYANQAAGAALRPASGVEMALMGLGI
jgi:hypothetical protein